MSLLVLLVALLLLLLLPLLVSRFVPLYCFLANGLWGEKLLLPHSSTDATSVILAQVTFGRGDVVLEYAGERVVEVVVSDVVRGLATLEIEIAVATSGRDDDDTSGIPRPLEWSLDPSIAAAATTAAASGWLKNDDKEEDHDLCDDDMCPDMSPRS